MREILFRGKRLDNGQWVYGYLVKRPSPIQMPGYGGPWYIDVPPKDPDDQGGIYNVDPFTVGQYTGLTDKNGKKIFEGDIIAGYFDGEKIIGTIVYGSNAQYYIERSGLYGIYLDNAEDWIEVIGNRWDNPELLEATP